MPSISNITHADTPFRKESPASYRPLIAVALLVVLVVAAALGFRYASELEASDFSHKVFSISADSLRIASATILWTAFAAILLLVKYRGRQIVQGFKRLITSSSPAESTHSEKAVMEEKRGPARVFVYQEVKPLKGDSEEPSKSRKVHFGEATIYHEADVATLVDERRKQLEASKEATTDITSILAADLKRLGVSEDEIAMRLRESFQTPPCPL